MKETLASLDTFRTGPITIFADKVFESFINKTINETDYFYKNTQYREALRVGTVYSPFLIIIPHLPLLRFLRIPKCTRPLPHNTRGPTPPPWPYPPVHRGPSRHPASHLPSLRRENLEATEKGRFRRQKRAMARGWRDRPQGTRTGCVPRGSVRWVPQQSWSVQKEQGQEPQC